MQHASATIDGLGRRHHLIGHRGGEHLTGTGGVQHPGADEPPVHRLVTGASAGHQSDLALPWTVFAIHDLQVVIDAQAIGVGEGHSVQGFVDHISGVIDEFLHRGHSTTGTRP